SATIAPTKMRPRTRSSELRGASTAVAMVSQGYAFQLKQSERAPRRAPFRHINEREELLGVARRHRGLVEDSALVRALYGL
ncbi:hypothetical protein MRO55_26155, partial [Escherichia coli]|uniref:hypothetical protein n=1 Tax=Escherichia coli TaxID=562 RepID=UPI0021156C1C